MTLDEVAGTLRGGNVAVIPTDTVYGIAALPRSARAVARIFELKGRPASKALPILAATPEDLGSIAVLDAEAETLARRYWPGPLTLVVERAGGFDIDLGGTDRSTIAVRVPDRPLALELLKMTGPLAVTSANQSGEAPAATPEEVTAALGSKIPLLDDGRLGGVVSTVLTLVGERRVLREGAIPTADLV